MISDHFRQIIQLSNAQRESLLRGAAAPTPGSLAGYEWLGFNISPVARLMGLQKFMKGFFQSAQCLEGYNIPVAQNGLEAPWLAKPTPDLPKRFGFYWVLPVDGAGRNYPQAFLLDYGASPRNPPGRIENTIRDYLAQPDPADPDVLLGKAYFNFGGWRVPSNFFVLQRWRAVAWQP